MLDETQFPFLAEKGHIVSLVGGGGKTTLLRHILNEQHGYKIAVIENEFGEVSVDDQLIGDRATQIKTLTNGCICCTRSSELEDALLDLLDSRDRGDIVFDRLVIECTGMADPGPIIQTFFSHEILCQRYLLDGVIALVDAVHADEQMNQFTIAQSQIGYADRILLTKTDVAGESEKLRERLTRINSRAPIYTVTHGDIDLSQLFNTNGFMLEENVTAKPRFHFMADKQNDVASIVVELDYPVDISEVSRVMENLLVPVMSRLAIVADELGNAATVRGMDSSRPRTSYYDLRLRAMDWLMLAAFGVVAAFLLGVRMGWWLA